MLQSNVTFGPNDTSQNVTVFTVDDEVVEYPKSFSLNIIISDQLKNIGIIPRSTSVTINIIDNDGKWSFCERLYVACTSFVQ